MRCCPFCARPMVEGEPSCIVLLGGERVAAHVWTCPSERCVASDVRGEYPDHVVGETPTGIPFRVVAG
jgi:hypothetical protein